MNRAALRQSARNAIGGVLTALAKARLAGLSQDRPFTPNGRISVVGFLGRRNGISRGAELQAEAFDRMGLQARLIDATAALSNPFVRSPLSVAGDAVIVHAAGSRAPLALGYLTPTIQDAFRIGYCAWELTRLPDDWRGFERPLHEVWSPSRFGLQAFAGIDRPQRAVAHVLEAKATSDAGTVRAGLGLEDAGFVALTLADLRSTVARKNPLGAIRAFRMAFQGRPDAALVVKITGAEAAPEIAVQLRAEAEGARVVFVDRYLPQEELWSLIGAADALVSLHRAEGFGIPMLEAMSLGKPVVATGWSGNTDFMTHETAALVPYALTATDDPQGRYRGGEWAEPDLAAAAAALRRLADDPDYRIRVGRAAAEAARLERQMAGFAAALPPFAPFKPSA